jgi:hypothetical protein
VTGRCVFEFTHFSAMIVAMSLCALGRTLRYSDGTLTVLAPQQVLLHCVALLILPQHAGDASRTLHAAQSCCTLYGAMLCFRHMPCCTLCATCHAVCHRLYVVRQVSCCMRSAACDVPCCICAARCPAAAPQIDANRPNAARARGAHICTGTGARVPEWPIEYPEYPGVLTVGW